MTSANITDLGSRELYIKFLSLLIFLKGEMKVDKNRIFKKVARKV